MKTARPRIGAGEIRESRTMTKIKVDNPIVEMDGDETVSYTHLTLPTILRV